MEEEKAAPVSTAPCPVHSAQEPHWTWSVTSRHTCVVHRSTRSRIHKGSSNWHPSSCPKSEPRSCTMASKEKLRKPSQPHRCSCGGTSRTNSSVATSWQSRLWPKRRHLQVPARLRRCRFSKRLPKWARTSTVSVDDRDDRDAICFCSFNTQCWGAILYPLLRWCGGFGACELDHPRGLDLVPCQGFLLAKSQSKQNCHSTSCRQSVAAKATLAHQFLDRSAGITQPSLPQVFTPSSQLPSRWAPSWAPDLHPRRTAAAFRVSSQIWTHIHLEIYSPFVHCLHQSVRTIAKKKKKRAKRLSNTTCPRVALQTAAAHHWLRNVHVLELSRQRAWCSFCGALPPAAPGPCCFLSAKVPRDHVSADVASCSWNRPGRVLPPVYWHGVRELRRRGRLMLMVLLSTRTLLPTSLAKPTRPVCRTAKCFASNSPNSANRLVQRLPRSRLHGRMLATCLVTLMCRGTWLDTPSPSGCLPGQASRPTSRSRSRPRIAFLTWFDSLLKLIGLLQLEVSLGPSASSTGISCAPSCHSARTRQQNRNRLSRVSFPLNVVIVALAFLLAFPFLALLSIPLRAFHLLMSSGADVSGVVAAQGHHRFSVPASILARKHAKLGKTHNLLREPLSGDRGRLRACVPSVASGTPVLCNVLLPGSKHVTHVASLAVHLLASGPWVEDTSQERYCALSTFALILFPQHSLRF